MLDLYDDKPGFQRPHEPLGPLFDGVTVGRLQEAGVKIRRNSLLSEVSAESLFHFLSEEVELLDIDERKHWYMFCQDAQRELHDLIPVTRSSSILDLDLGRKVTDLLLDVNVDSVDALLDESVEQIHEWVPELSVDHIAFLKSQAAQQVSE